MTTRDKVLILGHARHGKDTVGAMIAEHWKVPVLETSKWISENYMFDMLRGKYGYANHEECYEDRGNHRGEWYDLICMFNARNPRRLAEAMLRESDVYIGIRSFEELQAALPLFGKVIYVSNNRKPDEDTESCDIPQWLMKDVCTYHVENNGTLDDLYKKVRDLPLWS
jgi:hypothetical protein